MLTTNPVGGGRHFAVYAIDGATGDPTIRRADGEFVRVPRRLATTPMERCRICGRPLEVRDPGRTDDEFRGVCPDAEHHEYARLWRASRDPKLNRASRRRLQKRADRWLTEHLAIVRGRRSRSTAAAAASGT
jgi:hypothetical protein